MKNSLRKERLALEGLILFTVVTGMILASSSTRADSATDRVSWTIQPSCTMSSSIPAGSEHTVSMMSGEHKVDIGTTTVTVVCNDSEGLDVYVVGNSSNQLGSTDLISNLGSSYNIPTGVYSSGNTNSSWSMNLTNMNDGLTPVSGKFGNYMSVPSTWDKVAYRDSSTGATAGSSFQITYDVYASSAQPAGSYNGQVKYIVVHPHNTTPPEMPKTISDLEYMQDFATLSSEEKADVLNSMTPEAQYQLKDSRDQKDYYISKLADGNVWMTQNLELDLDSTAVAGSANALTSENTNLKTYGVNGYDSNNGYSCSNASTTSNCTDTGEVITWVPARTTVTELISGENSNFPNTTAANSTSYSYNPGDKYYYPTSATGDTSYTLAECESHNYTDCAHYKAGNYYNWSASVASNNTSSYTGDNTDAGNSVCPKGWRLSANEFQSLVDVYSITATNALNLRNSPLYFVRSGNVFGGSLNDVASNGYGYYWSSTVRNASNAYGLYFYGGYLNPVNIYYRCLGFPVRCVAE